jgi:hypothetical protein
MSIAVTISFTSNNPNTVWNRLKAGLNREPTDSEGRDAAIHVMRGGDLDEFIATLKAKA